VHVITAGGGYALSEVDMRVDAGFVQSLFTVRLVVGVIIEGQGLSLGDLQRVFDGDISLKTAPWWTVDGDWEWWKRSSNPVRYQYGG
jgi:hypothetical protein